jgi:hypothetical protein
MTDFRAKSPLFDPCELDTLGVNDIICLDAFTKIFVVKEIAYLVVDVAGALQGICVIKMRLN